MSTKRSDFLMHYFRYYYYLTAYFFEEDYKMKIKMIFRSGLAQAQSTLALRIAKQRS